MRPTVRKRRRYSQIFDEYVGCEPQPGRRPARWPVVQRSLTIADWKWLAAAGTGRLDSRSVDDPDGYFGEQVAASYDDPSDRMFQAEAVDPAVSLLAEL